MWSPVQTKRIFRRRSHLSFHWRTIDHGDYLFTWRIKSISKY